MTLLHQHVVGAILRIHAYAEQQDEKTKSHSTSLIEFCTVVLFFLLREGLTNAYERKPCDSWSFA